MASWITEKSGGVMITVRIVPRANKTGIAGELGEALKIRLQAPPVEGKANKALIEFLAGLLACSRSAISIESGDKGRNKMIFISGISAARATTVLLPALQSK